jgi:aspartate/methionine/tyrosine aminotransferase
MKIQSFELERYFARHEFSARYLLSSSDCESLSLLEIVELADKETIELWVDLKFGYTESLGHPLLRQTVAELYEGIEPDDVLIVIPEEGIFLFMHALLEPGDHVISTFPGYQSLYEVARSIGCDVSYWQPEEERGWHFDVDRFRELVRPETKLAVINFPHNPTGFVPPVDEYKDLVRLVEERGIYLLSDEMYRFLEIAPDTTLPAGCELYEKAFSLSGLSKSFGLPGLRIGWIVSRDRGIQANMSRLKDYTTICASAPSEILAIIALRNRQFIVDSQMRRIRRNIEILDSFFEEYGDCFEWNRPLGGSIGFPRLRASEGATDFCETLVRRTGVMLVPSSIFHYGDNHVRIGFGRENLPEVINILEAYLDQHYRQDAESVS